MIEALVKLANLLDENGAPNEADFIDSLILKIKTDEKKELKAHNLSYEKMDAIEIFEKLSYMADKLDSAGIVNGANIIDNFLNKTAEDVMKWKDPAKKTEQSKAYDDKYHHSLQVREPKEQKDREGTDKHHVETYQHVNSMSLNSRYCPKHIGFMLGRVGEGSYQCPLDGEVYNWEVGWTDYQGNKHPGGSVGAQTPSSTGYQTSHRIFDSRENTLNSVN